MMNRSDLPLHIIEQDYVQSIYLQEIYKETEKLVFKGGTYLKHTYGLDRFSEDLDFTITNQMNIKDFFQNIAERLRTYGLETTLDKVREDELSFNGRLKYRGPLFDGSDRSSGSILIEVSKRSDLELEPKWIRSFFDYPEVSVVNVLGMNIEEVLSEKLRALSMRSKGRDLYDVWYLLKRNINPRFDLFEKKMLSVGLVPDLKINIDKEDWYRDLRTLLRNPPEYQEVMEFVSNKLSKNSGFHP